MKKNIIYVDFIFTHKRIVSKKHHLFCKVTYLAKSLFSFLIKDNSKDLKEYPTKKIL